MVGQGVSDPPFSVVEEANVEVVHSEVVAPVEEVVGRNYRVAETEAGWHHEKQVAVELRGERGRNQREQKKRVDEQLKQIDSEECLAANRFTDLRHVFRFLLVERSQSVRNAPAQRPIETVLFEGQFEVSRLFRFAHAILLQRGFR